MQYSNCGLTNDLYNLSIVSLSLVTIVLLIIPKVELAFLDASAHCLDGFALLCMITPKSLSSSLTFNTLPPITYYNSWFPFRMCITEHFSRLNSICQSCAHLNILLTSSRSISASPSSPTALQSFVSSANSEILDKIPSSMSLMKSTNNSGPGTDPSCTPLSTVLQLQCLSPMPTFCLLPDNQL